MFDKLKWTKIIVLTLILYIFIIVETCLFSILNSSYEAIGLENFLWWEFVVICLFIIIGLGVLNSRKIRVLFLCAIVFVSGAIFSFLIVLGSSSIVETVLLSIVGIGLPLLAIVLGLNNSIQYKKIVISLLFYIGSIITISILYYNKPFFWTLIIASITFPLSLFAIIYSLKTYRISKESSININRYIKLGIVLIPILGACFLLFPIKTIIIDPKNSPEIIFWADSGSLPTSESTLQLCADNDVGFAVVVRDYGSYISNNAKQDIERLLNHSVICYIALGGASGQFYLNLDNADTFLDIFRNVRSWLISNNLYYYTNLKGFVIDAETSGAILDDLGDKSTSEKMQYFVDNIPSKRELNNAKEDLETFIETIHEDSKEIGIIKLPTTYDELDGDGDFAILSRNIYCLKRLNFDFSVSMNYRTQHAPTFSDYLITDMSQYQVEEYDLEYLDKSQLERNLVPISQFYYEVVAELNSNELEIERDSRFIFIGNFNKKFEDTSYIKDKEYKKDLDICRQFGVKKMFFYEWRSFKATYGEDELENLIEHNEDVRDDWRLTVSVLSLNREVFTSLWIAIADRVLYVY